ncbi:hypothetical protein DR864_09185 [Runella rosea]|uniref:Uncharacterized protein n=1 Tax=Runella rosea TaxID=2259595 RepID=A0A344TGX0_9BACT|nr:hypothetical protein [Runella rosea]AXE17891.1 hypothetical protein DR864_09185 [Runella rosea]
MNTPSLQSQLDDLPNNVNTLKNYIISLFGVIGSLTLEKAVLKQELYEAEEALLKVQEATKTSRVSL